MNSFNGHDTNFYTKQVAEKFWLEKQEIATRNFQYRKVNKKEFDSGGQRVLENVLGGKKCE